MDTDSDQLAYKQSMPARHRLKRCSAPHSHGLPHGIQQGAIPQMRLSPSLSWPVGSAGYYQHCACTESSESVHVCRILDDLEEDSMCSV